LNELNRYGIRYVWQIVQFSYDEVRRMRDVSRAQVDELKNILQSLDLGLEMNFHELPRTVNSNRALNTSIDDLTLNVRVTRVLLQLNIHYLGELARREEASLTEKFGAAVVKEIRALLTANGLRFGMAEELRNWTRPN
ncbi:MAG: hypothetical protein JNK65_00375, partial [Deltaproteobacteria bacterium]|nr:hypothetical protein [Deltaproteobacteria bacterium]